MYNLPAPSLTVTEQRNMNGIVSFMGNMRVIDTDGFTGAAEMMKAYYSKLRIT